MHTVVVSDGTDPESAIRDEILTAAGASIISVRARTPDAVIEAARGADAILVDARTPITADVLTALDSLRVVGRLGIGVDNIDVPAAAAADTVVVHSPGYCVDEVSTHAVGLLLACVRHITAYDRSVRRGGWDRTIERPPTRLAGRTIGLVGFGQIARAVAAKLAGFDVTMLAYDQYVDDAVVTDAGVSPVTFTDLLDQADIVSIHAPLTPETRSLFDAPAFARMSSTAILVNTARGPIVDEEALHEALIAGEIAGAGLDVFAEEPLDDSPLFDHEDVVLTPHIAWYSEEARRDRSRIVTEDVVRVLRGDPPHNAVDPDAGY